MTVSNIKTVKNTLAKLTPLYEEVKNLKNDENFSSVDENIQKIT